MPRIILASKSPRRKELLELLKLPFEIIVSDIDETIDYTNDLVKEIEKLSFRKADAVYQSNRDALIIGSDTIVKIDNKALGKPSSIEEAKEMLRELSDRTHEVVTGVTIINEGKAETFSSVSKVSFYPLTEKEIEDYVMSNEPMDKAGSYAIQGIFGKYIDHYDGDYDNVVGLPYNKLKETLNELSISINDFK